MPDPLCHRLSPLPRETSSEIGRHVELIFVRLYRLYTVETIGSRAKERGLRGEQVARAAVGYAIFVAQLRTGIMSLSRFVDRSMPRLSGLQSCFKTSVSVPAQLSPRRHVFGWEVVTVRTVAVSPVG